MGKRDIGKRETRKPKQGARRPAVPELLPTPTHVEVIKKKKERPESED